MAADKVKTFKMLLVLEFLCHEIRHLKSEFVLTRFHYKQINFFCLLRYSHSDFWGALGKHLLSHAILLSEKSLT